MALVDAPTAMSLEQDGSSWRRPLITFVLVAAALYLVVGLAYTVLPPSPEAGSQALLDAPDAVQGWLRFDSGWYVNIADNGYFFVDGQQSSVAFFPGYPLTVRAVSYITGNTAIAGLLVTFLSGAAVSLLWWQWVCAHVRATARTTAFLLLLLYPYAWYLYGTVYGDALFLAAVLAAFVLVEGGHPWWAALAGAFATFTRPVGPAVVLGLLAVAVHRSGALRRTVELGMARARLQVDRTKLTPGVFGVGLSAGGLIAYCTYLWIRFGDPVAFLTTQSSPGWDQGVGPRTWLKFGFLNLLRERQPFVIRLIPPAIATVFFLCVIPAVWRRFGWGYGVYTAAVVIIPAIGSGDFQGMARYLLAAFPVFALVGERVAQSDLWRRAAIATGGIGLVVGATLFSVGFYLA